MILVDVAIGFIPAIAVFGALIMRMEFTERWPVALLGSAAVCGHFRPRTRRPLAPFPPGRRARMAAGVDRAAVRGVEREAILTARRLSETIHL